MAFKSLILKTFFFFSDLQFCQVQQLIKLWNKEPMTQKAIFLDCLRCKRTMLSSYCESVWVFRNWYIHYVRTASCHDTPWLVEFDNAQKDGLSTILNVKLSDDQASSPVKDGGLGIWSAASLATSAFLASSARTNNLQSRILPDAVSMIHEEVCETTLQAWSMQSRTSALNGVEACSQKAWDSKCIQVIKDGLMANALSNKDKPHLLAS